MTMLMTISFITLTICIQTDSQTKIHPIKTNIYKIYNRYTIYIYTAHNQHYTIYILHIHIPECGFPPNFNSSFQFP